ncbi:hypothetical protein AB0M79_19110 [Polymorphospora sp. NPDC051019]|uniref:hypothetical protein n=1 Tax=Polymorphospora sp. NPDC051019 TaxID=3155725 RepID=UPI003442987F
MVSLHEATLSSGDGIVLVEDLDYEAVSAAIGGAFADSAGPPGTRGGAKLFGSSGGSCSSAAPISRAGP